MCPACHAGRYTMTNWIERTRNADDNLMVIPILESKKSIENIEEILAVDGIDVVHFGPGDLSADMGLDLNTQVDLLMDSWRKALDATRAAGKRMLAPKGFGFDDADMLIEPMDYMLLHNLASTMVAKHKGLAAAAQAEK
jgi:4-hydroxy-2-oxoheptanedioate aldolase